MLIGTIVEFTVDGLGWIDLDGGGRVRFGHSVCTGLTQEMFAPGTRVIVAGTAPGFRGVIKATGVSPLAPPPAETRAPPRRAPASVDWRALSARHSRFSDVDEVTLVPSLHALPAAPEPPAIFARWAREIVDTTPTLVGLRVSGYRDLDPTDPSADDCFSHGDTAFLEQPTWPLCRSCARPLEMCIQLSEAAVAPWAPERGGLCVMYCFHCSPADDDDEGSAFVRFVRPLVRAVGPASSETASSTPKRGPQRVTLASPRRVSPGVSWYRFRAARSPETAASAIFGDDGAELTGLDGYSSLEEVADAFEDWTESSPGEAWGGAALGGAPNWDQEDATPRCPHGEMKQLLEYEGEQFLDGAIHVFVCPSCPQPRFVAEF